MKTATALVRISLDPRTNRLRHPAALAVGVRGALLADLALAGCLEDGGRTPVITPADPTGDRILDILRDAVDTEPQHQWRRWYTYVRVDLKAIADELVDEEVWTAQPGRLGRAGFVDNEPDASVALLARTLEVMELRRSPTDASEAVLALLSVACGSVTGRPRPREATADRIRLLDVLGSLETAERRAVQACVDSAASAVAKRRRRSR